MMFITNKFIRLSAKTLLLSLGLTLVACGGGGDSSPAGIEYTGLTSPADVDSTNTQTYSAAIMDGSQDSQENLSNFGLTAIATNDVTGSQNKQYGMLSALVNQVKSDIENSNIIDSNIVSGATNTINGNCGGTVEYTSSQISNGVSVAQTFNNYCTSIGGESVSLSGSLTATVVMSGNSISSMNITIPRLKISVSGTETYTNEFSGDVAVTFTVGGAIASMTVSVNFVENGKVYKISNLSYTTTGADVSISGTLYHPDHGYVSFSTTEPFVLYNDQLCDGTLYVEGTSSNFSITAAANCTSYTYSGTNNLTQGFADTLTTL